MTVTARLEDVALTVEPATTAAVGVIIHNGGQQVEAYQLRVVGEPAGWATVEPAELSVYPGEERRAELVLAPPRSASVPAGTYAFGVRVAGTEQPDDVAVPEGQVEVLPFTDVLIELTPRTSHGRAWGRHELAVDNRGNAPMPFTFVGDDPDEAVVVAVHPDKLTVTPGEAAFARVRVQPGRRRWTGTPLTYPFRVAAGYPTEVLEVNGAMLQEPVLPKWLGKVIAAALAVAVLLVVAWMTLLRPVVRTTAQNAVQEPVAVIRASADQASKDAGAAKSAAGAAGKAASQAGTTAGEAAAGTKALGDTLVRKRILKPGDVTSSPDPGSPGSGPAVPGTSFSQRLESGELAAAARGRASYTIEPNQVVSVTDVFFENGQGDTGTVRVLVNDKVLFSKSLANFRDLDDHFVTPIVLSEGDTVTFETQCEKAGATAPGARCRTALVLVGQAAILAAG